MEFLEFLVAQLFRSATEGVLFNCILSLYPRYFMLGKKELCNARNLDLNKSFHFQPIA